MDHIIDLLLQYRYLILFPLAIVEGPILAVIAGFLCTEGYLHPLFVFPIIIAGDITGDSLCYMFGRWGWPDFLKKIAKHFGMNPEKIKKVRSYFDSNPNKTISLSKITLGIGFAGIYLAGNARVPYIRFIRICLATSIIQYVIYLSIGLLFGSAYQQISHYLNLFAAVICLLAFSILLFLFIKSIRKKL